MEKKHSFLCFIIVCGFFFGCQTVSAQTNEKLYQTDIKIDPTKKGNLYLDVDNLFFLKNDEYKGEFIKGYTLPGFWIQPRAVYYPLKNIKLEAGVHALSFWGAKKYPSFSYSDISTWKGENFQKGFHLLPFFRAHFDLGKHFSIVAGNLYGGANHRLIEPFYNPEMNLIADPEGGVQLFYESKVWDMDLWVNWESFIFHTDTHQEAFTVGFSSRLKYNNPNALFHFYSPVQVLGHHRGGEIDAVDRPVQMLYNAAAGVAAVWNANRSALKRMELGVNGAVMYKQKGDLVPFEKGSAMHVHLNADISDFRVRGAYWQCKDFATLLGNPMYGTVSNTSENTYFDSPKLLHFGGEYTKVFGKGYSLGVDLDVYYHFPVDLNSPEGLMKQNATTSFSFGVYFRVNPSFLLTQIKR